MRPSEAELEILQVLWEHQPCTVKDIHEHISKQREVGYTTTLKQMQRMLDKNFLIREAGQGKSHIYRAVVSKDNTRDNLIDRLADNAFGSSVAKLVMHALGKGETSKQEMEEIRRLMDQLDKKQWYDDFWKLSNTGI